METVLRATAIYVFLLVLIRVTGSRSVSQMTQFDFVLLLILGESTQQALLGNDFSVINCFIVITTLIGMDFLISMLKVRFPRADRWLDGVPVMLVRDGQLQEEEMRREHIDASDILEIARETRGVKGLDQVRYAILEKNGKISIITNEHE